MHILKNIGISILVIALVSLFVFALLVGVERQGRVDCQNLASEATQFSRWYATADERAQCNGLGIELPANRGDALE